MSLIRAEYSRARNSTIVSPDRPATFQPCRQFVSPKSRATGYGLMNMAGVFAGACITNVLGKSMDAGNLGRDFAMLAAVVLVMLIIQLYFLRPKEKDPVDATAN